MDCFTAAEHRHVLFDSIRPRLRFRVMNPIQNRVAVNPVETLEVAPCGRIAIEHGLQILRHLRLALRWICGVPSAVEPSLLDLLHPTGLHATELDQSERLLAIDLRPIPLRTARRKADQPMVRVELVGLSVNPAVTKRAVDCFLLRNARDAGRCLGQLQPDTLRRRRLNC